MRREIWDNIEGAANAGIFPVWYEDLTYENLWNKKYAGILPKCEHLHIHHWSELIDILENRFPNNPQG